MVENLIALHAAVDVETGGSTLYVHDDARAAGREPASRARGRGSSSRCPRSNRAHTRDRTLELLEQRAGRRQERTGAVVDVADEVVDRAR